MIHSISSTFYVAIESRNFSVGTLSHDQVTLLTDYSTESNYTTAYHTLSTNIRFNWDSERVKQQTVLFATPVACPRRTTIATNVAIASAQNGTPTILVDADLHTPSLQHHFGSDKHTGLSELLTEETITSQGIAPHLSKVPVPDLYLLSAGKTTIQPSQISRLLSAKLHDVIGSLRQFLAETESRPSMIIFHSSPVLAGTDAAQISTLVEQTFLIIASGHTTRTQAKQAQEQLQRAHAQLAGIVMLSL